MRDLRSVSSLGTLCSTSTAYRCWNKQRKSIVVSHNMVFIESQDMIPHPLCQNAPKSTPVNEPSADSDTESCENIDCTDACQPPPEVEGGESHADAPSDNEQTFLEPQNVPMALPSPPEVLTPQNAPLGSWQSSHEPKLSAGGAALHGLAHTSCLDQI